MIYTIDKSDRYLISERPVRLERGETVDTKYYIRQMGSMIEEDGKEKRKKKNSQVHFNTLESNPYTNQEFEEIETINTGNRVKRDFKQRFATNRRFSRIDPSKSIFDEIRTQLRKRPKMLLPENSQRRDKNIETRKNLDLYDKVQELKGNKDNHFIQKRSQNTNSLKRSITGNLTDRQQKSRNLSMGEHSS